MFYSNNSIWLIQFILSIYHKRLNREPLMDNTLLSIGNTTTLELDYEAGTSKLILTKPSEPNLMNLFKEQLSTLEGVTVCLSGGLDSQFTANLAKHFCKDVNAVCFRFLWDGNVINADDVLTATQFAELIDLDLHFEDIDAKDHLENNLNEYTRRYRTMSPQISVQLAAIKKSKFNDRILMLGGEAPTVAVSADFNNVFLSRKHYLNEDGSPQDGIGWASPTFYFNFSAPFTILEQEHGIHIIKDPFLLTPEILYAGYYQNKYAIESFGKVIEVTTGVKTNIEVYKQMYYKSFEEFDYIFPISKRTGFENLKFHLASQTGNYDEFDERYRIPLYNVARESTWYNPSVLDQGRSPSAKASKISRLTKFEGIDPTELEDIILNSVREVEPKACNIYQFDW
jgi:hypothetical protein